MRQHVNPLSRFFQLPLQLPQPEQLFARPEQAIHLDIGCARGRCLLGLAEQRPDWNHLGVEIRRPLVQSADRDADVAAVETSEASECQAAKAGCETKALEECTEAQKAECSEAKKAECAEAKKEECSGGDTEG